MDDYLPRNEFETYREEHAKAHQQIMSDLNEIRVMLKIIMVTSVLVEPLITAVLVGMI